MRWLHIYSSMLGLAAMLFFSVTGLTLNHPDWLFGTVRREQTISGRVNPEWVNPERTEVDRLSVVEHLRKEHRVRGSLSDFIIEASECIVAFQGPATSADTVIDRTDGSYQLTVISDGWVALMNDLHKGRHTGPAWSWVIDISAVLLALISGTGLGLLLYLKRRRLSGVLIAVVGLGACIWVYTYIN